MYVYITCYIYVEADAEESIASVNASFCNKDCSQDKMSLKISKTR